MAPFAYDELGVQNSRLDTRNEHTCSAAQARTGRWAKKAVCQIDDALRFTGVATCALRRRSVASVASRRIGGALHVVRSPREKLTLGSLHRGL